MAFSTSWAVLDPTGHREVGLDAAVQDRHPVKAQQQLIRAAERQARHDRETVEVEVWLVEPIEQQERPRPGLVVSRAASAMARPGSSDHTFHSVRRPRESRSAGIVTPRPSPNLEG
jgi:hypothetical protein